jgi:hypothetical protein
LAIRSSYPLIERTALVEPLTILWALRTAFVLSTVTPSVSFPHRAWLGNAERSWAHLRHHVLIPGLLIVVARPLVLPFRSFLPGTVLANISP